MFLNFLFTKDEGCCFNKEHCNPEPNSYVNRNLRFQHELRTAVCQILGNACLSRPHYSLNYSPIEFLRAKFLTILVQSPTQNSRLQSMDAEMLEI